MCNTAAMAGQQTAQARECCSPVPGVHGHPGGHQEWHAAGSEAAMHPVIDLALTLAGRRDSTAQDILRGVVELALGFIELRRPALAELASQEAAP